jgi:hypothetical protein
MRTRALLFTVLLLASCSGTTRDPYQIAGDAPSWPPPPETPRVQYVTSIHHHKDLFETGGMFGRIVRFAAGDDDTRMVRPFAIAIHPEGGLLITDPGAGCVHFYDSALRKYRVLGRDIPEGLTSPVGVAVARDGTLLVTDSRRRSIERFDRNGRSLGPLAGPDLLQRPGGLEVNAQSGEIYVVDVLAHAVLVLHADGTLIHRIGTNGDAPGQFNFPTHVALDTHGNLLVSDSMNFRIQKLTPEGEPLATFGEVGNSQGDFARPKGVAAIDDTIHVAIEGLYDSLIFFSPTGELLLTIGGAGSDPGQFWLPAGIAMDHDRDLLFVADSYNSRVQVFRLLSPIETGDPAPLTPEAAP